MLSEEDRDDKQVDIKAESSWLNPAVKSLQDLKDWILVSLGYPTVTVELDDSQLNYCIQNALEKYTKYAYFPERELIVNLEKYVPGQGLDLKDFNIASITEIAYQKDHMLGMNNDIFWGYPNFIMGNGGGYPFLNGQGNFVGAWTTWHNLNEFFELTRRMTGSNPQFRYDKTTKKLYLMPEPRKNDKMHRFALLTCEVEPPFEELYGNEYVKRLTLAYAKILLGTIRKKFANTQLIGGGTIDTTIGDEGREELNQLMENIRQEESRSNWCWVG